MEGNWKRSHTENPYSISKKKNIYACRHFFYVLGVRSFVFFCFFLTYFKLTHVLDSNILFSYFEWAHIFFFLLRRNFYGISLELAYFLLFFLACTFSRKKNHCKMYSEISTDKKTTTSFILIFALFLWNCTHTFHFRFIWIFFFWNMERIWELLLWYKKFAIFKQFQSIWSTNC